MSGGSAGHPIATSSCQSAHPMDSSACPASYVYRPLTGNSDVRPGAAVRVTGKLRNTRKARQVITEARNLHGGNGGCGADYGSAFV